MSEQNVREIQLGGKQLVFLFMASVVLAVAIFLLGISVGRGVGMPTDEAVTDTSAAVPPAPAEMPPPTVTSPEDLRFHDKLQDQTAPKAEAAPAAEPSKPLATDTTSVPVAPPPPPPAASSAKQTAGVSTAAPAPSASSTAKPTVAGARAQSAGAGWYVQVAAFKSRDNADRQVSQLKAKGYTALVHADPGMLFRVRIGPFQERTEANQTAERLQREDNIRASVGR